MSTEEILQSADIEALLRWLEEEVERLRELASA